MRKTFIKLMRLAIDPNFVNGNQSLIKRCSNCSTSFGNFRFKWKPLLDLLRARFSSVYIPGSIVTIDETMVPWQDRLSFKEYITGKAHKYGVKIYQLAATNGYTWNYIIYTSEQDSMAGLGHAQTVVMHLLNDLEGYH